MLVVISVVALTLAALVRQFIGASAFMLQQQVVLIILVCGLALNPGAITLAVIFVMRCVAAWQHDGYAERARVTLWMLGMSAMVILLPVLLAFVFPQHPAP